MEGYSVTEAASVLGVPTERIWELLARGVLSGAPEGETGMRVFLQPRPAPVAPEPRGPNGHSADPEREMSPFRELLTEFRNLTERYGQALLALGESRGEVAALRSRVDLLEARMDLRLPGGSFAAPPSSFPVEHAVIPTAPEPAPGAPDARFAEEHDDEDVRHRPHDPRRATESFAEALARAEDPSPSELPESLEATRARDADEAALPREVPAAESVPVADELVEDAFMANASEAAAEFATTDESIAIGEFVTAEESEGFEDFVAPEEMAITTEATPEEPSAVELHPEPVTAEDVRAADVEASDDVAAVAADDESLGTWAEIVDDEEIEAAAVQDEPAAEPEPAVQPEAPDDLEPAAAWAIAAETDAASTADEPAPAEAVAEQEDEPAPEPEPLDWNAERYTTTIDEPDWFEAEVDDALTSAPDRPGAPPGAAATEPAGDGTPASDAPAEPGDAAHAPEVAESRVIAEPPDSTEPPEPANAAQPPVEPAPLPGSADLDRALDALRRQVIESGDDRDEWPPSSSASAMGPSSSGLRPSPVRPPVTGAGRAYRRLRRIFPG